MIYIHDKDGNITNQYSDYNHIKIMLEYRCDGEYNNLDIDKSKKRNIYVVCCDEFYMRDWIKRNEHNRSVCVNGVISSCPASCIYTGFGIYSWWLRNPINIVKGYDYHFYYDKPYEKKMKTK